MMIHQVEIANFLELTISLIT